MMNREEIIKNIRIKLGEEARKKVELSGRRVEVNNFLLKLFMDKLPPMRRTVMLSTTEAKQLGFIHATKQVCISINTESLNAMDEWILGNFVVDGKEPFNKLDIETLETIVENIDILLKAIEDDIGK